ncbi:substrate-binding domain-containing protein [Polymorphospora rubra]|uniref:substrate-binding domain-containing protein n=1 Tax=Polymorphospora rubra TaxID=338584 RepID=UPI001BB41A0C|nr:substrate-binding domain-containing protein [Polymorphospora rubra]
MRKSFRGAGAIASVMALVVVAVGGWFVYRTLAGAGCSGEVPLNVAAAPEIAPAVEAAAQAWIEDGAAVDGRCVAVTVSGTDPVDVAAAVAGLHGISLAGVGRASGTAVMPDVWVPDSSTWLLRLSAAAPGFAPTNNASVAHSPVVVAMPEPVATSFGWPDEQLTWTDLLQQITTGTQLRTGIVDPTRDSAGLSLLLAIGGAASAAGDGAQQAMTGALRALATGRSALRQDLVARFPRSADPAAVASALSAAALSEEDVIAYNAARPPISLAALYPQPASMSLDYPYAVLPGTDPARAAAAEALFSVLDTTAFKDRLGARGLRGPDGSWGQGFEAPRGARAGLPEPPSAAPQPTASSDAGGSGAPGGAPAGGPDPAAVDRALSTWTAVTLPARMLAVIDVSGSMLQRVPTAGGATRMQVTLQAAQRGLGLFDDSWAVGLWTFSTELAGGRDYREEQPVGPLSSQRSRLLASLNAITPKPTGDTGLYDTVLAAYESMQEGWEPGRVNSVVMLTDGRNDDADGISQEKLLADLQALVDPRRPIQVVIIGIGDGVSRDELESITKVTGGGVFVTEDPAKIGDIFLQAIALRPAAPG